MRALLILKEEIILSSNTIAYILRKNGLSQRQKAKSYYKKLDYYHWKEIWEKFLPLQFFQVDLKDIRDSRTLPEHT